MRKSGLLIVLVLVVFVVVGPASGVSFASEVDQCQGQVPPGGPIGYDLGPACSEVMRIVDEAPGFLFETIDNLIAFVEQTYAEVCQFTELCRP